MKDYYYILGVNQNSDVSEIKTAYRKLSMKFHPDKNQGDDFFEERFKEIQNAYETLSDSVKRSKYDSLIKGLKSNSYKEPDISTKREKEQTQPNSSTKRQNHQTTSEKNEGKQISSFLIFGVVLSFFIIILVVANSKHVTPSQNLSIEYTNPTDIQFDTISNSQILKSIKENEWRGDIKQFDLNQTWQVILSYNNNNGAFTVDYPSLDCKGRWYISKVSNLEIEFLEIIESGKENCINGGTIRLFLKGVNTIEFFYLQDSVNLDAKGELHTN